MAEMTGGPNTLNTYFAKKSRRVRVIKGHLDTFEKELEEALDNGFVIPPGESMKYVNSNYNILVVKGQENVKKFI